MDKFKDQEVLQKSYESLEKEFTRRSQRLRELQGKIKQGTLIELKYPLHKAVYFLRKGAVEEGVIVSFNYNRYTNPKMWYSIEYYIPALKSYYVEVVKEDMIYPTREQAEKRLKELQNG